MDKDEVKKAYLNLVLSLNLMMMFMWTLRWRCWLFFGLKMKIMIILYS